ncbi:hypothetical protein MVEG_00079 [Podila verticillata NRRL 6337]|nr:hypothetical protein MVEG_00079 [Podila verticillata NRRL 6337]
MSTKRKAGTVLAKERATKKSAGLTDKDDATLAEAIFFFQDPPNVDRIINCVRLKEFKALPDRDQRPGTNDNDDHERFKVVFKGFRLKQQDAQVNRPRIMKAALYLRDHFQMLVTHGNNERLRKVNCSQYNPIFKDLARDISHVEPDLEGVSTYALMSLYLKIVKAKRYLDAHLAISATPSFTPTQLFKIAGDLVDLDDEIHRVKDAWRVARGLMVKRASVLDSTAKDLMIKQVKNGTMSRLQHINPPQQATTAHPIAVPVSTQPSSTVSPSQTLNSPRAVRFRDDAVRDADRDADPSLTVTSNGLAAEYPSTSSQPPSRSTRQSTSRSILQQTAQPVPRTAPQQISPTTTLPILQTPSQPTPLTPTTPTPGEVSSLEPSSDSRPAGDPQSSKGVSRCASTTLPTREPASTAPLTHESTYNSNQMNCLSVSHTQLNGALDAHHSTPRMENNETEMAYLSNLKPDELWRLQMGDLVNTMKLQQTTIAAMQERLNSMTSMHAKSEETLKGRIDELTNAVRHQAGVIDMLRGELDEQDQRTTTQAKKLRQLQATRPLGTKVTTDDG